MSLIFNHNGASWFEPIKAWKEDARLVLFVTVCTLRMGVVGGVMFFSNLPLGVYCARAYVGDMIMKKPKKAESLFSKAYTVKGDGVAVLRARSLKDIEEFRDSIRSMHGINGLIVEKT